MLAGLRERAGRVKTALGWWLMSVGLRLLGVGYVEELVDDSEDDEPAPAQDPLTPEAAAMIAEPRPPPEKPPLASPLEGSARARYHEGVR